VKLLGSYTYRDDQNLLFPVADMNLHEFFRKDGIPPLVILYAGMFGLSDALVHIHNFQFEDGNVSFSCVGYHHDLKPKNILVRGTTFLLADFGLSRLKMEDQSSRTRLKGGEDDYLSPESFNHIALLNGLVGRALDMWSFGCILAEFATFINFGTGGVDFFRENRKDTRNIDGMPMTDYAFHLNGLLRPAVNEWLVTLKTDPEDEYLPRLVDLVRELLKPEWRTRIQAQAASRKLASIYFDTRVGAIQALMSLLLVDQNQARPTPVLILLEQMRFAAWKGVYRSTIEGDTATSVNDTFKILEEMYHGLTLATQQPGSVTGNDIDSRLSASHKTICQHIDSLRSKFPETLKRDMDEDWIQAITEMDDIEMLDQIKAASIPLRYRLVGIKAAMKQLCLAIMDSREVSGKTMVVERGLVELDLRQDNKFSEGEEDGEDFYGEEIPQTGTYESETGPVRVLVEWLGYDARFKKYAIQMHARLEALAKLLSPEQTPRTDVLQNGILECVGYFHDECSRRFGFIYQMPPAESGTSDALTNFYTLNYIIRWRDPTMKSVRGPCLGDLFKFAHAFVSCVHGLHEVGWMHKRISSFSLLTFAESEDKAHEQVASCRLAGFSDSRPATSNLTMGPSHEFLPYQHPEYSLRTGYKRQYDYYSVGVVLLEVGLWTPISKIWSAHNGIDDTQAFRRTLLEAYVPELGERMGSVYRDAVALCLEAQALEDLKEDTTNQSPAQRSFKSGVVDMLAKCYA
jgi:serine/threonine protein kinase